MKNYLCSQFGNPRGVVGSLVGWTMAVENRRRVRWAVSVLDARPTDTVLEVGFGPGLGIALLAQRVPRGNIHGIDWSPLMVRQAERRNARAVREGRVHLRAGSVMDLPYEDGMFDLVFAINVLHHVPDPRRGLGEIHRVLKGGGRVSITDHPRSARNEDEMKRLVDDLRELLASGGFIDLKVETCPMRPAPVVSVLGTKPGG